ncbi:MAG: hypothetical protein WC782_05585 [Methylococcaceae bacterium]|jgi:hypothetical protein
MTHLEKTELALIPLLAAIAWYVASAIPGTIGLGRVLLYASGLLLCQSLWRDLCLLVGRAGRLRDSQPQAMRCLCLESTLGGTGIALGALCLGLGLDQPVQLEAWHWSALVALVLVMGFVIKDYVLQVRPWRLLKDKDHINIVVTWKS